MSELGEKLISIVRAKAEENPDFRYQPPEEESSCLYVYDGQPSCLIGHALWDAGVIDDSLEDFLNEEAISKLPEHFDALKSLSAEELHWLYCVQDLQDGEKPWGGAVEYADGERASL